MVTQNLDINQQASPQILQSAISQQASPHIPQSANYSHFLEQPRIAGYMEPGVGRTQQHFHPYSQLHSCSLSLSNPYPQPHTHPLCHPLSLSNPQRLPHSFPPPRSHEIHEAMQREIEKQRIREEIIMSEIVRRRVLEAEVRRELMLERELSSQKGGHMVPIGSSSLIGFESPTRLPMLGTGGEGRPLEERIIWSLTEKERRDNGDFGSSPFQRRSADLRISEVKSVSKADKEKGKILLRAKPDEDISRSKRKAVTPPAVLDSSELPSNARIFRKKVKEEWCCAICQVSATSEQALKEHLKGKKHKSKALSALRAGRDYSIGLFPKKATKSIHVQGTGDFSPFESLQPPSMENLNTDNLKKDDSKKNGYMFWCELCQVGSYSKKIINFHRRGKKHARRLEASQPIVSSQRKRTIVMPVNCEEVDEDVKNVDEGLAEDGLGVRGPDVADGAKDGGLHVS